MASFANQELGCPLHEWPSSSTAPALSTGTFDNSGDKIEWITQASEPVAITHVGFYYVAKVGTPPTFKTGLQGVGTTGNPDGTYKGGGSPASVVFTPPNDASWDATWQWVQLDNAYTPGRGEGLAVVLEYSSGTIDGSNGIQIATSLTQVQPRPGFPYLIGNNAGVRTRVAAQPVFGFKSATNVYGFPLTGTNLVSHSSDSDPNEYALAFNLPATWVSTYTVKGMRLWGTAPAAAKSLTLRLYEGTTVLQNWTWDSDWTQANASAERGAITLYFDESTLSTLSAGTTYRLTVAPAATTTNWAMRTLTVAAQNDFKAYPGQDNFWLSTRGGAAWSDVTAERPIASLILDEWTVASGSGGYAGGVFGG